MVADDSLNLFSRYIQDTGDRTKALGQIINKPDINQQPQLLEETLEELYVALEEMHVAEEELRSQNEELAASRQGLEKERQRYQELFEFAPDAYLVTDPNGKIQEANRAAVELFNLSHHHLIGKPLLIFVPEVGRRDFRFQLTKILQTERVQDWEACLHLRNGNKFDASITVSTVRDNQGKAISLRWMLRDITDRKQKEQRLRLLESVVVNANDAIIITEAESIDIPGPKIIYVNDTFTRMTGYTSEEVIGQNPRFLQGENTDRSALDKMRSALQNWQPIIVELINYRKDGSEFWVELSLAPVADEYGYYTHWISVQRDITDRKLAEEERTKLFCEQLAREKAQADNRAKDDFIAWVSHELRTPLNSILGWSQILRKKELDETVGRAIEIINRNAKLQLQLIEDLLDISRIIQGKIRLHIVPIELIDVMEASINTVRPQAEAKSIQIHSILDFSPILVPVDSERLQQITGNLLTNAVKFTPEGGQIKIFLTYTDSHAQIQVKDTGKGIGAEFLPYVFDRFRQAENKNIRTKEGLGLGLAISRQLVELHGGTIAADSPGEGQGATFTVRIPLTNNLAESHNQQI